MATNGKYFGFFLNLFSYLGGATYQEPAARNLFGLMRVMCICVTCVMLSANCSVVVKGKAPFWPDAEL